MLIPQAEGGQEDFGFIDVTEDVVAGPYVVNGSIAHNAARTAFDFFRNQGRYDFVEAGTRYSETAGIVTVGTYSTAHYSNHAETLFGNQARMRSAYSFITALKALSRFAGLDSATPDYVKVMVMDGGDTLPYHSDRWDGKRAFLQLAGWKISNVQHPSSPHVHTISEITSFPGDAYMMQFHEQGYSVPHETHYFSDLNLPNIALYLNA